MHAENGNVAARITPARAGKSELEFILPDTDEDHPRACGEKKNGLPLEIIYAGSPPRVRGKANSALSFGLSFGITPARAGKSNASAGGCHSTWDHPRACGEKGYNLGSEDVILGSPPRVRGKARPATRTATAPGITPARAGKSIDTMDWAELLWDHPRACGEKLDKHVIEVEARGSPPRVRGKADS